MYESSEMRLGGIVNGMMHTETAGSSSTRLSCALVGELVGTLRLPADMATDGELVGDYAGTRSCIRGT